MSRDDDAATPADVLTLVMPLTARAGMTNLPGLAEFQASFKVQMDDGINFPQEIITYQGASP